MCGAGAQISVMLRWLAKIWLRYFMQICRRLEKNNLKLGIALFSEVCYYIPRQRCQASTRIRLTPFSFFIQQATQVAMLYGQSGKELSTRISTTRMLTQSSLTRTADDSSDASPCAARLVSVESKKMKCPA